MKEKKVIPVLFFLFFIQLATSSFQHQTCGGSLTTESIENVIKNHIKQLVALRRQGEGWFNTPEVVIALQLSKHSSSFSKKQAMDVMKREFGKEFNNIPLGKLAMYAMAVRSLCENPRDFKHMNLLDEIERRLKIELQSHKPNSGYGHALALQALCINNVTIESRLLKNTLNGFLLNGSFDNSHSVDTTSQMMIALKCVSIPHMVSGIRHHKRKIRNITKDAAELLKSQTLPVMKSVWIGNKYSTPLALSALKATRKNFHHKLEETIYRSLASCGTKKEPEAALSQRLITLSNQTVLALKTWECEEDSDTILSDFDLISPQQEDPYHDVTITVRLAVEAPGIQRQTWLLSNVPKRNTLLKIMQRAKSVHDDFDFVTTQTAWGPSVTAVQGVVANSTMNQYWALQDGNSGDFLSAGVGQYRPSDEQTILFKLHS